MRGFRITGLTLGVAVICALAQDLSYVVTTVAGSDWVGDGGPATEAILLQSEGVAVFGGSVYFSDALTHRVREVRSDGTIRTIAGTGQRGFSGDEGTATAAELNAPYGLVVDRAGNLYIADLGNSRVRRVTPDGRITTIVSAPLRSPRNLAISDGGTLFISDFDAHRVYSYSNGVTTLVAGNGTLGFQGEGGPATSAQIGYPAGLAVDSITGVLYIGDTYNRAIRRVSQEVISTVARVPAPTGMAVDANGTLHVADPVSGLLYHIPRSGQSTATPVIARDLALAVDGSFLLASGTTGKKVQPSGLVSVIAGGGSSAFGDRGKATAARLNHPSGAATDANGNLYIADRDNHRIRRVSPEGSITTIAGTGEPGYAGDGGLATLAQLNRPSSVSLDSLGSIYIADTGNQRIRIISPQGRITSGPAGGAPVNVLARGPDELFIADELLGIRRGTTTLVKEVKGPRGLALDLDGNLYFSEADLARVRKLSISGQLTEIAPGAWRSPRGLMIDSQGNLLVADAGRHQIVRVDLGGRITAIAGTGVAGWSGDGDAATLARLSLPWDIAPGPQGSLLIADLENNRIRQLSPATLARDSPILLAEAVNAASGQAGPIVAGMLVALRNTGIQPGEIPQATFSFGGKPGQFLSIDSTRILVLAPPDSPNSGPFTIDIYHQGLARVSIPAVAAPSAPALFTNGVQAAASNANGSANHPVNGAVPGSIIAIYGTGLGQPGLPVSARVGNQAAEILYAGPTGDAGIFQVNLRIPENSPAGMVPIVFTVGDASTQPTTIAVSLPGQM